MTSEDLQALQDIADSIEPSLAIISVETKLVRIFEEDRRPGYEGENRLALRDPCLDCSGTGETIDIEGFPDVCLFCSGKKEILTEQFFEVDLITLDIGHRTKIQVESRSGKGRVDKRAIRSKAELEAWVVSSLGKIAIEVARIDGNEKDIPLARAEILLDVAARTGMATQTKVDEEKAAHRARDAEKIKP